MLYLPGTVLQLSLVLLLVFITNEWARVGIGIAGFVLELCFLCWMLLFCTFGVGFVDEQELEDFDNIFQLSVWLLSFGIFDIGPGRNLEQQWARVKASGGRLTVTGWSSKGNWTTLHIKEDPRGESS